ncbi:hypothetical protein DSO57_1002126 [Entomophthora muscae]|uniref:Uncharacterized protein n=1 Tax=Entomophthora muscae TaxID=34485 RepID=A0ACC2TWJ5_9FUNG|nr:hypothetical protein DSO57_1002126 [Entomophthora muscae]
MFLDSAYRWEPHFTDPVNTRDGETQSQVLELSSWRNQTPLIDPPTVSTKVHPGNQTLHLSQVAQIKATDELQLDVFLSAKGVALARLFDLGMLVPGIRLIGTVPVAALGGAIALYLVDIDIVFLVSPSSFVSDFSPNPTGAGSRKKLDIEKNRGQQCKRIHLYFLVMDSFV